MKVSLRHSSASRAWRAGFTLAELMTAIAIFSLVVTAVVYSHLFGMRMFNLTATRLSASYSARGALNQVRDEVRSSQSLCVGSGDIAGFTNLAPGQLRQGSALQIYPTTATNVFVRYYVDAADQRLKRITNGWATAEVVADYLTNQLAFTAEDFAGNILTNDTGSRVVKMSLDMRQWELPGARGTNALYSYYHLQTRITRRSVP